MIKSTHDTTATEYWIWTLNVLWHSTSHSMHTHTHDTWRVFFLPFLEQSVLCAAFWHYSSTRWREKKIRTLFMAILIFVFEIERFCHLLIKQNRIPIQWKLNVNVNVPFEVILNNYHWFYNNDDDDDHNVFWIWLIGSEFFNKKWIQMHCPSIEENSSDRFSEEKAILS